MSEVIATTPRLALLDTQYTRENARLENAIARLQKLRYRYASDNDRTPRKLWEMRHTAHTVMSMVEHLEGIAAGVLTDKIENAGGTNQ